MELTMGRMYVTLFDKVAVSAVQDLFQLSAASNVHVILHELRLSQITEEASEIVRLKFHRGSTDGSSGGGTHTPNPLDPGAPAADTTAEINNTTQSTEGAIVFLDQWNLVQPYLWMPTPESRIHIPGGGRLNIELEDAPDASTTMSGALVFEELG